VSLKDILTIKNFSQIHFVSEISMHIPDDETQLDIGNLQCHACGVVQWNSAVAVLQQWAIHLPCESEGCVISPPQVAVDFLDHDEVDVVYEYVDRAAESIWIMIEGIPYVLLIDFQLRFRCKGVNLA